MSNTDTGMFPEIRLTEVKDDNTLADFRIQAKRIISITCVKTNSGCVTTNIKFETDYFDKKAGKKGTCNVLEDSNAICRIINCTVGDAIFFVDEMKDETYESLDDPKVKYFMHRLDAGQKSDKTISEKS